MVNEHCQQTWRNLRAACLTLLELESTIREAQGYERLNIASKVCTLADSRFFLDTVELGKKELFGHRKIFQ